LPHIRAKSFDVTALALSVNGFEGERRFAGTARSGNNGQFSERKIDIDAFKIIWRAPRISTHVAAATAVTHFFSIAFEPTGDNPRGQ